jgi:hypothetical protein
MRRLRGARTALRAPTLRRPRMLAVVQEAVIAAALMPLQVRLSPQAARAKKSAVAATNHIEPDLTLLSVGTPLLTLLPTLPLLQTRPPPPLRRLPPQP